MKKFFLLFNHALTTGQEADAHAFLGVESIVPMPRDIQEIWGCIPPDIEALITYLEPVFLWLRQEADAGDYVLIQGDFGAVYQVVQFAFEEGYIPVYSTTLRKAEENYLADGTVSLSHVFRHERFRRYGR
jgi:hypothetical protein